MPRHKLGHEVLDALQKEHPNITAAIWRGRHAFDPDVGNGEEVEMCRRSSEAEKLERALLDVEHHLCRQKRDGKFIACPFFDICGYQRQKLIEASIWIFAHELLTHEMPKTFGDIGWLVIDESPLDAFIFGVDVNDRVNLAVDDLNFWPEWLEDQADDAEFLMERQNELLEIVDQLKVPSSGQSIGLPTTDLTPWHARRNAGLEYLGKLEADIHPAMDEKQVLDAVGMVSGQNSMVSKRVRLWRAIQQVGYDIDDYGRVQVYRHPEFGRTFRIIGLHKLAKGWDVQTLIADATGNVDLLRAIWPHIEVEEEPWPQLPRPECVRVYQMVDRTFSKYSIAIEARNKKELERKQDTARSMYAALLLKALEYGGAEVAAIVYKSTEEFIRGKCFVPSWLRIAHHGALTGTNIFENVRAIFSVGRNQPPPEAVTQQAEALFGAFIPKREYIDLKARIPIKPDKAGHTSIQVTIHQHPDPVAKGLLWQSREAAAIQAENRARPGLRGDADPLDVHRWTDLPLPELGPVEPLLWGEIDPGLDGLMLAVSGIWLRCIPDAARAFPELFTANTLKVARQRQIVAKEVSEGTFMYPHCTISNTSALAGDSGQLGGFHSNRRKQPEFGSRQS